VLADQKRKVFGPFLDKKFKFSLHRDPFTWGQVSSFSEEIFKPFQGSFFGRTNILEN
jgi:hypothetical protein